MVKIIDKFKEITANELIKPRRGERNTRKSLFKKYNVDEWYYNDKQVITIYKQDIDKHIIYLHGGAYISEASILHRRIIKTLANKYKVTFIDYPLAPESNYKITNKHVLDVYKLITNKYKEDKFYLFGDSAGGGLALSLLEQVRDYELKPIIKSVLISPWIDLTMDNPDIDNYRYNDLFLSLNEIKKAAYLYSNGEYLRNPLLSPIYGNLENIGSILLFVGEKEILYPDIMRLYKKIKENVTLIKGVDMYHDWVIFPSHYSNECLDKIIEFYDK